jgi:PleD family two-component response regulator
MARLFRTLSAGPHGGSEEATPACAILVVDDLATERERMLGILQGAGWRVRTAMSGAQAIEAARGWIRPNSSSWTS